MNRRTRPLQGQRLSPGRRAVVVGVSALLSAAGVALAWMYLPEGYFVLSLVVLLIAGMVLEGLGFLR